jgi:signal transduction histidine kinase
LTAEKALKLAGGGPTSELLEKGLPIFYKHLVTILKADIKFLPSTVDQFDRMAQAASASDEHAMAVASGRQDEMELAKSASLHGSELLRLGYTLSHVVHAYGAMCQSINELASEKNFAVAPDESRHLNQCLDVAIAAAVTEFSSQRDTIISNQEVERLGALAHELRNSLHTISMAFQLIKDGMVTPGGNTGQVMERGLTRLTYLIDRSLTEVRLRVEPELHVEVVPLLQLVDHIVLTSGIEAKTRRQVLEIQVDPVLKVEADQQLVYSALSNLIQNAIKYTPAGGKIQVRGKLIGENIVVEVEDECGGLSAKAESGIFKPFEQNHENRKGLGLGLSIAQRSIVLSHGTIECQNLPGKGCIFRVRLPRTLSKATSDAVNPLQQPTYTAPVARVPEAPADSPASH